MGERLISIEERNATLAGRGKRRQREIGTFIVCRMQGEGKGRGGGEPRFRPAVSAGERPVERVRASVSARAIVVSREGRRGSRGRATRESESKRGRTSDSFPSLVSSSPAQAGVNFHTPSRRRNRRGAAPPRATPRVRLRNAERTRSPAKRGWLFPRAALTNIISPPPPGGIIPRGRETMQQRMRDAILESRSVRFPLPASLLDLPVADFEFLDEVDDERR
jgi:hypothetical protein